MLVYVEHTDGAADEVSLQAIALAQRLSADGPVDAMLAGPGAPEAAAGLGAYGVGTAHVAEHEVFASHASAALARAITELATAISAAAVLAPGT
jgi:electron transfer flavoprotein alpha subunit